MGDHEDDPLVADVTAGGQQHELGARGLVATSDDMHCGVSVVAPGSDLTDVRTDHDGIEWVRPVTGRDDLAVPGN